MLLVLHSSLFLKSVHLFIKMMKYLYCKLVQQWQEGQDTPEKEQEQLHHGSKVHLEGAEITWQVSCSITLKEHINIQQNESFCHHLSLKCQKLNTEMSRQ